MGLMTYMLQSWEWWTEKRRILACIVSLYNESLIRKPKQAVGGG